MTALTQLRMLSRQLAQNPLWIQGAGGNTSVKEADTLWVKASGVWLERADAQDAFVALDIPASQQRNSLVLSDPTQKRPSIEAFLHLLMPHRFVAHTHAISALLWLCRSDAQKQLQKRLDGLRWAFVPYSKPGQPLAEAIRPYARKDIDIIMLGHHGVVVGHDTVEGVERCLQTLEARLALAPHSLPMPDLASLASIRQRHATFILAPEAAQSLAFSTRLKEQLSEQQVFYPDHAVFLYDLIHLYPGHAHTQVLIIPEVGVLQRQDLTPGAQAMLCAYAQWLLRLPEDAPLVPLDTVEVSALVNWEAEHYRKKLTTIT